MRCRSLRPWRYELLAPESFIVSAEWAECRLLDLVTVHDGRLVVGTGYAWDGPTWCPDFRWLLRASLAHDALYQLRRERPTCAPRRADADRLFWQIARREAPRWARPLVLVAWLVVRAFGGPAGRAASG